MANFSRPSGQKETTREDAQKRVLELLQDGFKVADAMRAVGRTEETYRSWMKDYPEFKEQVRVIRSTRAAARSDTKVELPDFETFCRDYLKQPLFPHQLRMLDVIEGRPPRDLHPSMTYAPGYPNRVVVNIPPEHAKSTTFSVNYVVWNIYRNPDIRVVIMSQGQTLAKRFLGEIKFKLTAPFYRESQILFGPEGGWKDDEQSWTADAIYVRGKGGDKDPTVQALGLNGQIYGTRSDLIILDDTITTKNAREIDKQTILLDREIESRLPSDQEGGGQLLILGTRVAPMDLYKHLKEVVDADDERVWTYFRMPAVLDYGNGDSATWETLWPEKWNGKSLAKRKRSSSWNLVYQQLDVDDDMTFRYEAVEASINGRRFPGPMTEGAGRSRGMDGLYVVGGFDPASVGNTAILIVGLDMESEKRYVLDGVNKTLQPHDMKSEIKRLTEKYGIHEWVIEKNGLQTLLTRDRDLVDWLRSRGCRLSEHHTTSSNKFDADFGVATMAPLFESCGEPDPKTPMGGRWRRTPDRALIELPSQRQNQWVNDLIEQLTTWMPQGMGQKQKTDLVMALWFTHIGCTKRLERTRRKQTHMSSPFTTPGARKRQGVINLAELRRERHERLEGAS